MWLSSAGMVAPKVRTGGSKVAGGINSTSREYRSNLESISKLPVDFIGISSIILDEFCLKTIENFFEITGRTYESIQLQLGCHGIMQINKDYLNDSFYADYKNQLINLVEYLQSKCKKLILATATQIVTLKKYRIKYIQRLYIRFHDSRKEVVDTRYEMDLVRRNEIVREVGMLRGCCINDLYTYMKNEGVRFRHKDHVHYEDSSKAFIARRVMDALIK